MKIRPHGVRRSWGLLVLLALSGTASARGASPATIAAARNLPADSKVMVEGYVTVAPGTCSSATSEQGFAIQDASAGIYVSLATKIDLPIGTRVRVAGTLEQANKQTQIKSDPASVMRLGGKRTFPPKDLKTGDVKEPVEGLLVQVSGRITKAIGDDRPYGYKVFIDDGSGEIQVFVHIVSGSPVVDVSTLAMGNNIKVTGLTGQYNDTYEVIPREKGDLVKLP